MGLFVFLRFLSECKYAEKKEFKKNVYVLRNYLWLFMYSLSDYIKQNEMLQTCSIHAKDLGKIYKTLVLLYVCD
jgi:hypothetical protein